MDNFDKLRKSLGVPPTGFRQCSIEPRQVEEIFVKAHMYERRALTEWLNANQKESKHVWTPSNLIELPVLLLPSISDCYGRPEWWQFMTVDTNRYASFKYKKLYYVSVPPKQTNTDLFSSAMEVLKRVSMPLCLILARYERISNGYVVGVDAPRSALRKIITANRELDRIEKELKEKGEDPSSNEKEFSAIRSKILKEAKEYWADKDLSEDLYNQTTLSLFNIRNQYDPPCIILYSTIDTAELIVWFRDFHLVLPEFHDRLVPMHNPKPPTGIVPKTKKSFVSVSWPLVDHARDTDPPERLCENPQCSNGEGEVVDANIQKSWVGHVGPRKREIERLTQARMKKLWREKYEVLAQEEIAKTLSENPSEDCEKVKDSIFQKYEDLETEEEPKVKEQVIAELFKKLSRCGRCKRVAYCSVDCQKADWNRHKLVCAATSK